MVIGNSRWEALAYAPGGDHKVLWGDAERLPPGWLPADLASGTIRWIHVGSQRATDPFFDTWVSTLRSSVPPPREHETELSSLAQNVAHIPEAEPTGIIFHVTRCGSTLLQNALSAGQDVFAIGEAPAIDKAAQLAASRDARVRGAGARALKDVCKAFAYYHGADATQLIIKTGIAGVARLGAIRAIWPRVPCVMLIRDPLEVSVSNLRTPSRAVLDWYHDPSTFFSAVPEKVSRSGIGEFCAWLFGWVCNAALEQLDEKCVLLDYRDLNSEAAFRVAELFAIQFLLPLEETASERPFSSMPSGEASSPPTRIERRGWRRPRWPIPWPGGRANRTRLCSAPRGGLDLYVENGIAAMLDVRRLFQPDGLDVFLARVLGRHALFLEGDPDRFRAVISWDALNHLAAFGGLTFPRFRLIRGDEPLDENLYVRRDQRGYPRALVSETNALLRQGALLAIDGMELLHEAVAELCAALEAPLRTPVAAELYACWCEGAPRPPQWDDHETILLQIEGRKDWSLFEPTAYYPMAGVPVPPPTCDAKWSGTLKPGGLLYVPRGWWYQDKALLEPALYLALTFQNLKAVDMMARLLLKAQGDHFLRMDVPWFLGAEARSSFLTMVQSELAHLVRTPGLLNALLHEMQESSDPRSEFNFPWSPAKDPLPPGDHLLIPLLRFPGAFSTARRAACDPVMIPHNGSPVTLEWQAGEILELICAKGQMTVRGLFQKCESRMSRERILAHVLELVGLGLVAARPAAKSDEPERVS